MQRVIGLVPLALVTVAASAAAAMGIVQDDPFGTSAPSGPWGGDRSAVAAVSESDQPRLECADREPLEIGIFDYVADLEADDLDPLQRARSVISMSSDPSLDPGTATWVDVGPARGVVTFLGRDGGTRALVHFELWEPGWFAVGHDRCVPAP